MPRKPPEGELVLIAGASGSGKTYHAMKRYGQASRLLVWDSHLQWCERGALAVRGLGALAGACAGREPWQLAYTGPATRKLFPTFCRIALLAMRLAPCTVVVEELAEVTSPGKAPDAWGDLIRWTRKLGGRVVGITQRPAESDKTLLGNAHRVVAFSQRFQRDEDYMGDVLRLPRARLATLDPARWEYFERRRDGRVVRGPGNRPV